MNVMSRSHSLLAAIPFSMMVMAVAGADTPSAIPAPSGESDPASAIPAVHVECTTPTSHLAEWTAKDLVGIAAILFGPISAVYITRLLDARRDRQSRRMDVFRALMRTRSIRLNVDHVAALNLVEVEFEGEEKVVTSWKAYMKHLSTDFRSLSGVALDAKLEDGNELLTLMLHEIAKALGIRIEQLDILKGGYSPIGWHNELDEFQQLRRGLIDLLEGRRALPMYISPPVVQGRTPSPYPPAPAQTDVTG